MRGLVGGELVELGVVIHELENFHIRLRAPVTSLARNGLRDELRPALHDALLDQTVDVVHELVGQSDGDLGAHKERYHFGIHTWDCQIGSRTWLSPNARFA